MVTPYTTSDSAVSTTAQSTFAEEAAPRPMLTGEQMPMQSRSVMLMRSYVSWASIIAGTVLALSLLILSASLAYACGVPAYFGGAYGWGAGIWSVVTAAVVFFCGGCVAAYFATAAQGRYRVLHGVMVWALAMPLLAFFFAGTLGAFISHTGVVLSGAPGGSIFPSTGAAWGSFISIGTGLVFAFFGGGAGSSIQERMCHS